MNQPKDFKLCGLRLGYFYLNQVFGDLWTIPSTKEIWQKPGTTIDPTYSSERGNHRVGGQDIFEPEGGPLTIYDANGIWFQHIRNEEFDNYFINLRVEVLFQTQL